MATLDEWVTQVCRALGLPPESVDARAVLNLARDVAHGVDRPAAPLTAYLAGLAVGRGTPAPEVLTTITALIPAPPATDGAAG